MRDWIRHYLPKESSHHFNTSTDTMQIQNLTTNRHDVRKLFDIELTNLITTVSVN